MDHLTIFILAVALGTDAALVSFSIALKLPRITFRHGFRLAFHFGLFQGFMTFLGWAGGSAIRGVLTRIDHWLAFGLLTFVGVKMIFESSLVENEESRDPSRGLMLVTLALATSIDALAVGIGLAVLDIGITLPAIGIGVITALMCIAALVIGNRGRHIIGLEKYASLIAGLVLLAIGVRILYDHGVFSFLLPHKTPRP